VQINSTLLSDLKALRSFISPDNWTKGSPFRDSAGITRYAPERAVRAELVESPWLMFYHFPGFVPNQHERVRKIRAALHSVLSKKYLNVVFFNDDPKTTFEDVLCLI